MVNTHYGDDLCLMPGLPPMHHWENRPQVTEVRALTLLGVSHLMFAQHLVQGVMGRVWMAARETYEACSGIIVASPEAYEPEAIAATRDWMAETGRQAWVIGPLLPPIQTKEAISGEEAQSAGSRKIKEFMRKVLVSHGEHSMLYVSIILYLQHCGL